MEFDPQVHKIVAVVDKPGDPNHGHQFYLSLPELVAEAADLPQADLTPVTARMAAIEAAVAKLKAERGAAGGHAPHDLEARLAALEEIPLAQLDLAAALKAVVAVMEDMDGRAAKLEDEARVVRATLEDSLPVLMATVADRR